MRTTGGAGGGEGVQPNVDRPGQGEGGSKKISNLYWHPLWMTPKCSVRYIKPSSIDYVLYVLNSFHKNIKFSFEKEQDNKISFLDDLILRNGSSIDTTVYRKFTHNDIYLHWNSFSPNCGKVGTLKTVLLRTFVVWTVT